MKSKTFCVMPWNSLATNASGFYRVCCNSTPQKNVILDKNGTPMKIFQHTPSEVWNSLTYTKIREQMINGERPEMCERCFKEEDSGIESARVNWNKKWYNENREYAVKEVLNIQYVDLRLGNLCNLKCRMCNPYSSSQWVEEWNSVVSKAELVPNFPIKDEEALRLSKLDWPTNIKTWDSLIEIADTIEEVYLTGGEPTLAIEQYKLFDILIEKNLSKKIKLKYNTNLTNIPKKMIDYWENFKRIQINASIDAYGDLNRYIRYPTAWASVEKNIGQFVSMTNIEVQLHCTVQTYNILYLNELFNWMLRYPTVKLYLNILNHPRSMNIRVLPAELKKLAEEKLQSYLDLPKVKQTIKYMNDKDDSEFLKEFFDYTITLDEMRNQDFFKLVPEFKKYFMVTYGME
jgi:molybdenum cofactor biosynthesis enzyme MoaA